MKGKIATILCLLMLSSGMVALAHPAKAADGIPISWVEPSYVGYDAFYDEDITGYVEGSQWGITFMWANWGWVPINVSAIRLYFDWGKNYTYNFATPIQVMPGVSHTFTAYNVTPSIEEAFEPWTHYYTVYIEHVNNTAPPYEQLSPMDIHEGGNFAVLSADHLACLNYMTKYWMFIETGPLITVAQMTPFTPFYTNISQVQVLLTQAIFEFSQGAQTFMTGIFDDAASHFTEGDSLINEALNVWSDRGTAMEDVEMNYKYALGEASKTNAYGWLLFGLGWVFIGIGIIVYAARKPKAVQIPPSA